MPPKIRVVKPNIGTDNIPAFLKRFSAEIAAGKFDAYLDVLYRIVDDRVREYQVDDKPDDEETQKKLASIRKMRGVDFEPKLDGRYGVIGEKYRGLEVIYHGEASAFANGNRRAKVQIAVQGNTSMEVNSIKLIPMAALMELPEPPKEDEEADMTRVQKI